MHKLVSILSCLTISAALASACVVEDYDDLDEFEQRMLEADELEELSEQEVPLESEVEEGEADVAAPKVAELYDNCGPLTDCGGTTCSAGGCWYQPAGSIWKIPGTDIPCFHNANDECRCNIANKATVVNNLVANGWTIGGDAPRMADDDAAACEPYVLPDAEPDAEPL